MHCNHIVSKAFQSISIIWYQQLVSKVFTDLEEPVNYVEPPSGAAFPPNTPNTPPRRAARAGPVPRPSRLPEECRCASDPVRGPGAVSWSGPSCGLRTWKRKGGSGSERGGAKGAKGDSGGTLGSSEKAGRLVRVACLVANEDL